MNWSLPRKLTTISVIISTIFTALISYLLYTDASIYMKEQSLANIQSELIFNIKDFRQDLENLKIDVALLGKYEDIQPLNHAIAGEDTHKYSKAQLRTMFNTKHVEHFFKTIMSQRPYYVQARYIDKWGQEIIRINKKTDGTISSTPTEQLQDKSDESYYKELFPKSGFSGNFVPIVPTNDIDKTPIFLSKISLNREHGKISLPITPVIRASMVISIQGIAAGMLVLNADFSKITQRFTRNQGDYFTFIADQNGNYLVHPKSEKKFSKDRNLTEADSKKDFHRLYTELKKHTKESVFTHRYEDTTISAVPLLLDRNSNYNILIATVTHNSVITAKSREFLKKLILLVVISILLIAALILYVSRIVLKPIHDLTQNAKNITNGIDVDYIDLVSQDEVGDLTLAINIMLKKIRQNQDNLKDLNRTLEEKVEQRTEALRKSDLTLKAILDNAPSAIYLKDSAGHYIFANKAFEFIFGVTQHDLIGKRNEVLFSANITENLNSKDNLARLTESTQIFEDTIETFVGEFCVITHTFVIQEGEYQNDGLSCGIIFDITDRQRALKRVEEERAKSISFSQMATLGEMAGGMAHEINNPLAIIHGTASQMKRLIESGDNDRTTTVKLIDRIEKTTERISKIIKGLRAFSRNTDDDPKIPTHITDIIDNTMELCRLKLKENQVKISITETPDLIIECREAQIGQVLLNLINNAIDATKGLQQNEKWIQFEISEDKESVYFQVTNGGPPIPEEIRPKLMQPFFTTKEIGRGTGLGLSISKGIIEEHSGNLYLNDKSSHTSFEIRIPKISEAIVKKAAS